MITRDAQDLYNSEIHVSVNDVVKFYQTHSAVELELDNMFDEPEDEEDEPAYREILNYWSVEKWLYEKLQMIDEPVVYCDELDLYIWGQHQSSITDTMQEIINAINGEDVD